MHLDEVGNFVTNNGFTSEIKAGFTPLTQEIMANKTLLYKAKQSNKKWLINTIAEHSKKSNEDFAKLFFSEGAIKKGASVLGRLDEYKPGDVLFIGWGRPDSQKGFPTTLEGYLQFIKNPDVATTSKEHAKMLLGAGPWPQNAPDWKIIQNQMKEIGEIEGGKYAGNVCYLNGFFTNRIVACADYSNITSRYEPCGITPLESYAGATPVISNNTGGSPDFVKPFVEGKTVTNETGFLTKNAYLVNPEVIGANSNIRGVELDAARRVALGKENAKCIEEAMDLSLNRPKEYKTMMMNALSQKTDWHENIEFNGQKSALLRYKEEAWAIGADNKELIGKTRNNDPLSTLKGSVDVKEYMTTAQENVSEIAKDVAENTSNAIKDIETNIKQQVSTTKNKYIIPIIAAVAVLGVILAKVFGNKKSINPKQKKITAPKPVTMLETPNSSKNKANFVSMNNYKTMVK